MKRLHNDILQVRIRYSLDDVEKILFKFTQGSKLLFFRYPSEKAFRKSEKEDVVCMRWSRDETGMFDDVQYVEMDSMVKLNGSDINPRTAVKKFKMSRTLFTPEELMDFD